MSTDKYPTISSVKPVLYKLIEKTLKMMEQQPNWEKEYRLIWPNDIKQVILNIL